jgi:Flp pilus assembly protein TadB
VIILDILIILRLVIVIIIVVIIDLILKLNKAIKVERRLARYSIDSIDSDDNSLGDLIKIKYNRFIRRTRKKFKNNNIFNNKAEKYNKYIMTGDKTEVIDFIITKLILGICFVFLVTISGIIQGKLIDFLEMIISFIIGYYIYDIYLIIYNKRRTKKIKNDMLRSVIIMNNAFKVGKSTLQAVEIASNSLPKPISIEFKKIYQDLSFGISSDIAFSRFSRRVNLEEARYISSSLTILNKTGGNIVAVFSSIERTLFEKKKLEEDLKNSTSASNLIVKVLMIIPLIFTLIIYVLSPNYFDPLFSSTLGYMLLVIIAIMFIIYIYLLNKIMKVKV